MDITTLIPAYKPKYFPELINALESQTYTGSRVIISDDSPNEAFLIALKEYAGARFVKHLNLSVVKGPQQGGRANIKHLVKLWGRETELVHFLFDDDLIYPEFYRAHVEAQQRGHRCTVSRRWIGLENGQPIGCLEEPRSIRGNTEHLQSFSAQRLFPLTVGYCRNWLGELSNTVFHRDLADVIEDMALDGIPYDGLEDIGSILRASTRTPVGFIGQRLGMFRRSPEQNTANPQRRIMKLGQLAWFGLAFAGHRIGYLQRHEALRCIQGIGAAILAAYGGQSDMRVYCELIPRLLEDAPGAEAEFLARWSAFAREPAG